MIDLARIRARTRDDQLRTVFAGQRCDLIKVDAVIVSPDSVWHDVVKFSGKVDRRAMCEMSAVRQIHCQISVPRFEDGQVHRHVGLRPGVGLDIGVVGPEQFARAVAGEFFNDVDVFAAAVIPPFGVALGVFVRQHRAGGLHGRRAGVVL